MAQDESEKRSRQRRVALMTMASAFLVWQVPGMDWFERVAGDFDPARRLLSIVGFVVWAGALLGWLILGRAGTRGASAAVASALEDELVKSNRLQAFLYGYVAVLVTSAAMFGISLFQPISGTQSAHLILVVAVVVPIYAFVFLERSRA